LAPGICDDAHLIEAAGSFARTELERKGNRNFKEMVPEYPGYFKFSQESAPGRKIIFVKIKLSCENKVILIWQIT
jgi:hypothetical protein